MNIYEKLESVVARQGQLEGIMVVFERNGVEVWYKTP